MAEDDRGAQFLNDAADYRKLELLVAKIQQELAPNSKVSHNVRLPGASGADRQIDVLVEDRVGQYDIRIVIDCKDYKTPVDIKGVEECAGLFEDVAAMRGVIVCPAGFTKNAKARAQQLQIDLYSPVDTDPHKWQARLTMPAIADLRKAKVSFRVGSAGGDNFRFPGDFLTTSMVYDERGTELGTIWNIGNDEWAKGNYPIEPGAHDRMPLLPLPLLIDNGLGGRIPIDISVTLQVERLLFFGQYRITRLSGFRDEIRGGVIANALEGLISMDEIETKWRRLASEDEAPVKPVVKFQGLYV